MIALALMGLGGVFILAALWNRTEPRRALILFIVGGILVLAGGLTAMHGMELS